MAEDQKELGQGEKDRLLASSNERDHQDDEPEEAYPEYKQGVRDNSQDTKFMFCFPMKCAVISIGVYIILNLLFNCY